MTKALVCWKCGASLKSVSLPLGHYDLCPICREELHVCMMCRSYDPAISGKCRKEEADYVGNKEQANYCHYFLPRANAYKSRVKSKAEQAREELSALFGQAGSDTSRSQDYDANAKQLTHGGSNLT